MELDEVFLAGAASLLEEEIAVAGLDEGGPDEWVDTFGLLRTLKEHCPQWFAGEERRRRLDSASRRYYVRRAGENEFRMLEPSFRLIQRLYRWCAARGIRVSWESLPYLMVGVWRPEGREIALAHWATGRMGAQTLLHECLHAWRGHVPTPDPDEALDQEAGVEATVEALAARLGLDWHIVNFTPATLRADAAVLADEWAGAFLAELDGLDEEVAA